MTHVLHYDIATGHKEVVISAETHDRAEELMAFLVSQDHGTDDVYFLEDVPE